MSSEIQPLVKKSSRRGKKEADEVDPMIDFNLISEQKNFRTKLDDFLKASRLIYILHGLVFLLSIALVVQFVYFTYNPLLFLGSEMWAWGNLVIRSFLLLRILMEVLSNASFLDYVLSFKFLVEMLLVLPYLIFFALSRSLPDRDQSYLFHLSFINMFASLNLSKLGDFIENEVNRQIVSILVSLINLIIIFAGACQYVVMLENGGSVVVKEGQTFVFFDYFYFVMTIISTVGYGNPFFPLPIARLLIVFIIIVGLALVPARASELMSILSEKSVYSRMNYKQVDSTDFIVLCGNIGTNSVINFLMEFFHEDHGLSQRHCVILDQNRPDNEMENLLRDSKYEKILVFIQGNPLDEVDLKRVSVDKAKSVIVLCNKHSVNAEEEDGKTILISIFIKKYLSNFNSPAKLCIQVIRTEGKSHYALSSNKQVKNDQLICLEELKLSLFAKSCICPGLIALVTNLINSSGDSEPAANTPKWLEEYFHGIGFEIYKTPLSNCFKGKQFSEVAGVIYREFNAILFGIETVTKAGTKISINPRNKLLTGRGDIVGYLIAEDRETADLIRDYTTEERVYAEEGLGGELRSFARLVHKEEPLDANKMGDTDLSDQLRKSCYVSKTRINLSKVTFETMHSNILATKHIILTGRVTNLYHFVVPLRSRYLSKTIPIVILNEEKPDAKTWNQISYFSEIYFIEGSALNEKDLYRANIKKASRVVIMTNKITAPEKGEEDDTSDLKDKEDLLDAQTIFKYLNVARLRPDIPIITELVHPSNISFLINNNRDYSLMKKYGYYHTEMYSMGEIYISSVMDTLIAQAYYNSALVTVLDQLLVGSAASDGRLGEENGNLLPLRVPFTFVGKRFSDLFNFLCEKKNIIALGIYRYSQDSATTKPYVVTNPPVELVLTGTDMVFVLTKSMIDYEVCNKWGSPLEDDNLEGVGASKKGGQGDAIGEDGEEAEGEHEVHDYFDKLNMENKKKKELLRYGTVVKSLKDKCERIQSRIHDLGLRVADRSNHLMRGLKDMLIDLHLKDARDAHPKHNRLPSIIMDK
jgi:hypothetical protein